MTSSQVFISYSRSDCEQFAIKLTNELRAKGANIWLDRLDISPGVRWDVAIENALKNSGIMLVVLSPKAIVSDNVLDEISYAIDEGMKVIPVIAIDCTVPYRLRRFQRVDLTKNYDNGFSELLGVLGLNKTSHPEEPRNSNQPADHLKFSEQGGRRTLVHALGIETAGESFTKIIPEGTGLPYKKTEIFSTASDNQPGIDIHLLSGLSPYVRNNKSLGLYKLNGIPTAPKGIPQIEISFEIDRDGILQLNATDIKTGRKYFFTISPMNR